MGLWLTRLFFCVVFTLSTYLLRPFGLTSQASLILGLALSGAVIALEISVHQYSLKSAVGGAIGAVAGILTAALVSVILDNMAFLAPRTQTFLQALTLIALAYLGLNIGITKLDSLGWAWGSEEETTAGSLVKIIDTSVIIDGRVGDVVETGFLEGRIIVPEFVLRELQSIADSSDSIKRNRGRRGLDILRKIQKKPNVEVEIVEKDYPEVREVDLKLIELAREFGAKIVTNDYNLNKVAKLRGVDVLNINELANSLKAVVLPGESMSVFILKEGKEYNQGVAYLDDGTMVVVDNARKMIGKTVDIEVTSVLQTTAGKMIFGKYQMGNDAEQRAEFEKQRVSRL